MWSVSSILFISNGLHRRLKVRRVFYSYQENYGGSSVLRAWTVRADAVALGSVGYAVALDSTD